MGFRLCLSTVTTYTPTVWLAHTTTSAAAAALTDAPVEARNFADATTSCLITTVDTVGVANYSSTVTVTAWATTVTAAAVTSTLPA